MHIIPPSSAALQTVNTCVDSLDIRVLRMAIASDWLTQQLSTWRDYHQTSEPNSAPFIIELPGLGSFRLHPTKSRPYEFVLINPEVADVRIWNPDKWSTAIAGATGQFYVSFRSRFLQFHGTEAVKPFVEALTALFCDPSCSTGWIRVSRADLAADVQMQRGYEWADLDRFVTRARWKDTNTDSISLCEQINQVLSTPPANNKGGATYNVSEDFLRKVAQALDSSGVEGGYVTRVVFKSAPQTIYFGRFQSPLYARLYDKLASLDRQGKEYMRQVWQENGWDGSSPVWRHEFSLSGDFLRAVANVETGEVEDLRSFDLFVGAIGRLWRYLTCEWLKFTDPDPGDSNPWRWGVTDVWAVVQMAFASPWSIVRCRPPRQPDDKQLEAQFLGVAKTLAAKRSTSDDDTGGIASVASVLFEWMDSPGFTHDLRERRQILGIDDYSDTVLSALYRAERILEGLGS